LNLVKCVHYRATVLRLDPQCRPQYRDAVLIFKGNSGAAPHRRKGVVDKFIVRLAAAWAFAGWTERSGQTHWLTEASAEGDLVNAAFSRTSHVLAIHLICFAVSRRVRFATP
jgi:hypothetical protein